MSRVTYTWLQKPRPEQLLGHISIPQSTPVNPSLHTQEPLASHRRLP